MPRVVGAATGADGAVHPYPKLSVFSFTSNDETSPYHNAYWTDVGQRGAPVQQARFAWDRLRNVLDLEISGPRLGARGTRAALAIRVTNSGSGHKFPTGFPEGRVAWLAVHAYDLGTGRELDIADAAWKRTSRGVGGLTTAPVPDPVFPACPWKLPPGSPDPYAVQFKAVATLGDGCPTLDLVYAHPQNLVVNRDGQPIDPRGRVIDRNNPREVPRFEDRDGDGDVFDDAFLTDTRLDPLPLGGATLALDRYAVVIPPDAVGPIAVSAAVYYQSVEAIAARKFLGNLADTDLDFQIEPCVLGGLCDGRTSSVEPAVVEGSPAVPMEVRNWLIAIDGPTTPAKAPAFAIYPAAGATDVYRDVVVKVTASEPLAGLGPATLTLRDERGALVPATVDQIADGTWALFPDEVFLKAGQSYAVRLGSGVCSLAGACTRKATEWRFTIAAQDAAGRGDTRAPAGYFRANRK
jgi:hypothetical protein